MTWEVPVEVTESPIHGMGVFAKEAIKAGTKVWSFDRSMYCCEPEELHLYDDENRRKALLGGYLHIPTEKFIWYEDGMQYVNHAEGMAANIGTPEWLPLDQDCCVATRDIQPGEEFFEDYGFWTIFNLPQNHWLRLMYLQDCPQHYFFMQSLADVRRAA
ncbi:MAG: SET domain-containing protein [Pseudomonadota bacterium]